MMNDGSLFAFFPLCADESQFTQAGVIFKLSRKSLSFFSPLFPTPFGTSQLRRHVERNLFPFQSRSRHEINLQKWF